MARARDPNRVGTSCTPVEPALEDITLTFTFPVLFPVVSYILALRVSHNGLISGRTSNRIQPVSIPVRPHQHT